MLYVVAEAKQTWRGNDSDECQGCRRISRAKQPGYEHRHLTHQRMYSSYLGTSSRRSTYIEARNETPNFWLCTISSCT